MASAKRSGGNRYVRKGGSIRALSKCCGGMLKCLGLGCLMFLASFFVVNLYQHVLQSPYFRLKGVHVAGCERVQERSIVGLMGVSSHTSLLDMDLVEMARRIESNPWIARAEVRRSLPDELWVRVWEHRPLALVNLGGLHFMDTRGHVFKKVDTGDNLDYPLVTGLGPQEPLSAGCREEEYKERILAVFDLLARPDSPLMPGTVSEIHVDRDCGLELITRERTSIRLGGAFYEGKLHRLGLIMKDLSGRGTWRLVESVDLDFGDQAVVRYRGVRSTMENA